MTRTGWRGTRIKRGLLNYWALLLTFAHYFYLEKPAISCLDALMLINPNPTLYVSQLAAFKVLVIAVPFYVTLKLYHHHLLLPKADLLKAMDDHHDNIVVLTCLHGGKWLILMVLSVCEKYTVFAYNIQFSCCMCADFIYPVILLHSWIFQRSKVIKNNISRYCAEVKKDGI